MSEALALTWDVGKYQFQRKLGSFVQYFQINLPNNSYGVPLKIIDPLIIAEHMVDCDTTDELDDQFVMAAERSIEFEEGLPIIDGTPIWERFEGETLEYYTLFKSYREMLYEKGARSISNLGKTYAIEGRYLSALAKVYHWQLRCRAYDAFKEIQRSRKRLMDIESLEGKHAKAADTLMEQALTYLEGHPEQLNPKVAVQMIQVAMKAGRLALGLNADKPGSGDGNGGGTNITVNHNPGGTLESSVSVEIGDNGAAPSASDLSHFQSILHVLDKSGALDKAKIVDADFTVVEDDEVVT